MELRTCDPLQPLLRAEDCVVLDLTHSGKELCVLALPGHDIVVDWRVGDDVKQP